MMTEIIDYNIFVNNDNKKFVDAIIHSGHKIELHKILLTEGVANTKLWMCTPQGDTFKLSFYTGGESIEYFTHEILHAYYITSLGFTNTQEFYNELQVDSQTSCLLSLSLIGHINNVFAHEKFFKTFLKMNFQKEKFTSDFCDKPIFYKNEIEISFDSFGLPNVGISYFISTYFSCVDCRNGLYESEKNNHFEFLKSKDSKLFEIVKATWERWLNESDIKGNKEIISEFILNVSKWYKEKNTPKNPY
jgi:hypothetical protein